MQVFKPRYFFLVLSLNLVWAVFSGLTSSRTSSLASFFFFQIIVHAIGGECLPSKTDKTGLAFWWHWLLHFVLPAIVCVPVFLFIDNRGLFTAPEFFDALAHIVGGCVFGLVAWVLVVIFVR